ncbi:hypothetical protein [Nocardia gipuzkoensis]
MTSITGNHRTVTQLLFFAARAAVLPIEATAVVADSLHGGHPGEPGEEQHGTGVVPSFRSALP